MMQDWAGWLLMLFSFSIVLMWKSVRSDTKVVHAIWFCLVLHHAVAFFNAYVGTVIGIDVDALKHHAHGIGSAASPEPVWAYSINGGLANYTNSLGLLYRTFGPSLLLGGELSILAFTLTCIVLVRLVSFLDLGRFRIGIILIFGLLPSAAIFGSATLRESWQALFFLLFVYWAIRLQKRPSILILSFMLMSALCMASLHLALKGYVLYLIPISIYWGFFGHKKGILLKRYVIFLFAGLLIVCVIMLSLKMGWYMSAEYALKEAEGYRQDVAALQGRTDYGVMLNTSSVLGIVKTIPMIFVQYMFTPFPWQVQNVSDFYVLLESMLRFVLLFFAVSLWRRSSSEVRSYYSFLLIVFLGLELVWALGTVNWGTAIRHHMLGYSVIVLLGAPGLILFMRKIHIGMFGCRKDITMLPK